MSPRHVPEGGIEFTQRIRDVLVADAIAAQAGTEETPELLRLSNIVQAVIPLQPRPPLAISGYFPGTLGLSEGAVALNLSHIGIFASSDFNRNVVCRVNWIRIYNTAGGAQNFTLRRDDAVTGYDATALVPGYINAGATSSGGVFSIQRNDTVGAQGTLMAAFRAEGNTTLEIPGPWIINAGGLVVVHTTVNATLQVAMGYEVWPSIRDQPAG